MRNQAAGNTLRADEQVVYTAFARSGVGVPV